MSGKIKLLLSGALIAGVAGYFALKGKGADANSTEVAKSSTEETSTVNANSVNEASQSNEKSLFQSEAAGNDSETQRTGGPENVQADHGPTRDAVEGTPPAITTTRSTSDPYMSTTPTPH